MITPIENGGTARETEKDLFLLEYTQKPTVLNGWIFSIFDLYDFELVSDDPLYELKLQKTIETLKKHLQQYNRKYWCNYDIDGENIASPFYHNLHISQLDALSDLFDDSTFKSYMVLFSKYKKSFAKRSVHLLLRHFRKFFRGNEL